MVRADISTFALKMMPTKINLNFSLVTSHSDPNVLQPVKRYHYEMQICLSASCLRRSVRIRDGMRRAYHPGNRKGASASQAGARGSCCCWKDDNSSRMGHRRRYVFAITDSKFRMLSQVFSVYNIPWLYSWRRDCYYRAHGTNRPPSYCMVRANLYTSSSWIS